MSDAPALGAISYDGEVRFAVRSATAVTLCLWDGAVERRVAMTGADGIWSVDVPGIGAGQRYGFRAAADPAKLLVDPYAVELDRAFVYDPRLGQPGVETGRLVPWGVVVATPFPHRHSRKGGDDNKGVADKGEDAPPLPRRSSRRAG